MTSSDHVPVLLSEVMEQLSPAPGDTLLDATVGHAGHAQAFLEATAPTGRLIGLDPDPQALDVTQKRLERFQNRVHLQQASFAALKDALQSVTIADSNTGGGMLEEMPEQSGTGAPLPRINHVLFDLGIGSHQLADEARGFSFQSKTLAMAYGALPAGKQTLLEMPPSRVPALDVLARRLGFWPDVPELLRYLSETELASVLHTYGEERYRGRIAAALKASPQVASAREMADRIASVVPGAYRGGRIHPATRTFQALRLAVNRELENIEQALPQAVDVLAPTGRLVVISFHSLEDRIVKQFIRDEGRLTALTKKPIVASAAERDVNPRARSAKLRSATKVP